MKPTSWPTLRRWSADPVSAGSPLPAAVRSLLQDYFTGFDLGAIRLYAGIPRYVRGRPAGYADRNRIFLAGGYGAADHPEFVALIAHELVHSRQYGEFGAWKFRWLYLREYLRGRLRGLSHQQAYRNISFERAARIVERRVRRDLLGGLPR